MKTCLWALGAFALTVSAQTSTQSSAPAPAPSAAKEPAASQQAKPAPAPVEELPAYVRRISAGATLVYMPLALIKGDQIQQTQTVGPIEVNSDSSVKNRNKMFGGGIVLQVAVKDRWAIVVNGLFRQTGYDMKNTIYVGPNRKELIINEVTTAKYLDFPLLVRRYNTERTEPGFRWFYEAGGSLRHLWKTSTSIKRTENDTETCCDSGPASVSSKNLPGVTGGVGMQFNDDFGIRIVPEVRYTWWLGRTFDSYATRSQRHQVDVMISFTF